MRNTYTRISGRWIAALAAMALTLVMFACCAAADGVPAITKQPVDTAAMPGKTAKITVSASGDGLTYSWYYKDAGTSSFKRTSSFKGTSYSVQMTEARDGRQVYCVITDQNGNSVTTDTVTLRIAETVRITAQPQDVTVVNGKTAKVTIAAEGDGLTYKWYYKDAGTSSFKRTTSFKGTSYSVQMNSTRSGRQIYCLVTDKYGNSVKTDVVTLNMQVGVVISKQPVSISVKNGETAKVTISASGEGLKYQWYYKNAGDDQFALTTAFTGKSYAVTMNASRAGRQVYCVITDKHGKSAQTDTVTIDLDGKAVITDQPVNATAAQGATVSFTVKAEGDGLKYQWYFQNATATKFTRSTSATSATYSFKMTAATSGRTVYCKVTDKYGNVIKSETATANMEGAVTITQQPVSERVKVGGYIYVTVKAQGTGLQYSWYRENTATGEFELQTSYFDRDATYLLVTYRNMPDTRMYCVVTDANGVSARTDTVTLGTYNVDITKQPKDQYASVGDTVTFTVEATGYNLTYSWYRKSAGYGNRYYPVGENSPEYSFTMTADADRDAVYCHVIDEFGTGQYSNTAMIYLPDLKITDQPLKYQYMMAGDTATLQLTVEGVGLSYAWYYKNPGMSDFKKSSITSATYSSKISLDHSGRIVYCIVTDKSGQTVQSESFILTAYAPVKITTQPNNSCVRDGKTASSTCKATGWELTYQWYVKEPGSSSFVLTGTTGDTYTTSMSAEKDGTQVYCIVTDKAGNTVKSSAATLTMEIVYTPDGQILCPECDGDGDCQECGGDMWVTKYEWIYVNGFPQSELVTKLCDGIWCYGGSCGKCGGDGYVEK